jgi:WD40 repeat protein
MWDASNGCEKFTWNVQVVSTLAYARDGALLACGASDCNVWLWDTATGEAVGCLQGHMRPVVTLAFSPNGSLLASGDYGGIVKLWDVASKKLHATLTVSADKLGDEAAALVFSPDGQTLAVAVDRTVQLWDMATDRLMTRLSGHEGKVKCLAFSPDGRRLASGSYDQTVRLWDVTPHRPGTP